MKLEIKKQNKKHCSDLNCMKYKLKIKNLLTTKKHFNVFLVVNHFTFT